MSKFKAVAVMVAVIAFLGYCVWLSPNLFGNRIRNEMVSDSLLKYDRGADVYIASKDDNSKVYFGQSGKYRFYGTGALAMKASPVGGEKSIASGFNLLIEGGELEIKSGQADILTGSVSPNGQFLALLKVDGKLSIHDISSGKTTFESKQTYFFENPLDSNRISYPNFYWTDQGLIAQQIISASNDTEVNFTLFPWQEKNQLVWGKKYNLKFKIDSELSNTELVSIEPSTGNINVIPSSDSEKYLYSIIGTVDQNSIICIAVNKTNKMQPNLFVFNLSTSTFTLLERNSIMSLVGYSNDKFFSVNDNVLVYSKISAKSASAPVAIDMPTLDGEKLTPDLIENLRVTSKGYLHFRHIKTAKTYLLEPVSGVYVEIPIERYPY